MHELAEGELTTEARDASLLKKICSTGDWLRRSLLSCNCEVLCTFVVFGVGQPVDALVMAQVEDVSIGRLSQSSLFQRL